MALRAQPHVSVQAVLEEFVISLVSEFQWSVRLFVYLTRYPASPENKTVIRVL